MGEWTNRPPWMAFLLGVLVTGLGHLYVGRWRRGAGWLLTFVSVNAVVTWLWPLSALAEGVWTSLPLLVSTFVVSAVSVADLVRITGWETGETASGESGDDATRCPECARRTSDDLAFCRWCGARVAE